MRRIARVAIHFNRSTSRYNVSRAVDIIRASSGPLPVVNEWLEEGGQSGRVLIQKGLNKFAIGRTGNTLGKWRLHIWITMLDDSNWYRCLSHLVRGEYPVDDLDLCAKHMRDFPRKRKHVCTHGSRVINRRYVPDMYVEEIFWHFARESWLNRQLLWWRSYPAM